MGYKFFIDHKPWNGDTKLFIAWHGRDRKRFMLAPAAPVEAEKDQKPFLGQTWDQVQDGMADVDNFLQAALDAAWERGMRPAGFKDFTNELVAVRYHLEDMRKLALVPHVTVSRDTP